MQNFLMFGKLTQIPVKTSNWTVSSLGFRTRLTAIYQRQGQDLPHYLLSCLNKLNHVLVLFEQIKLGLLTLSLAHTKSIKIASVINKKRFYDQVILQMKEGHQWRILYELNKSNLTIRIKKNNNIINKQVITIILPPIGRITPIVFFLFGLIHQTGDSTRSDVKIHFLAGTHQHPKFSRQANQKRSFRRQFSNLATVF